MSAKIELETTGFDVPDSAWLAYPKEYEDYVTDRADGFFAGLMPTAMTLGENVVVKGSVSPRLAWGIREYQELLQHWWRDKGWFSIVDIDYEDLCEPTAVGDAVGCTVSGGVDSFYSLWKHRRGNESIPGYEITHGLMINGFDFDTDLDNTGSFRRTAEAFRPVIEGMGARMLTLRSNIGSFRSNALYHPSRLVTFEAPITACVLTLAGLFAKFYVPGSTSYDPEALQAHGPDPASFPLLSTERIQIIADGFDADRAEKTAAISQWEDSYSTLRVCWRKVVIDEETGLIRNCCRCEKCVRTMLALDIVGALPKYKTFPLPLIRRDVWRLKCDNDASRIFLEDNVNLAKGAGRSDRVFDLWIAAMFGRLPWKIRRYLK